MNRTVLLSALLRAKGTKIVGVGPDASVAEAARLMTDYHIGALVVQQEAELVGIVTERDILNKVVSAGLSPSDVAVHSIMTKEVVVIDPGRSVRQAMQIVTEKKLRHLPVVRDDTLVGLLSGGDLTRSIVEEEEGVIDTLCDYIRGGYPG